MKTKWVPFLLIVLITASFYSGCSFLPYGNKAPAIDSAPLTSIKVEQVYTHDVNANDLEDDVLTYSLLTCPEGMTIDTVSGVINWTPTKEQIGEHEVTVNVEDRWRNDIQNFTIDASDILLTSIDVIPSSITLTETYSNLLTQNFLTITANYDYGSSKSIALSECNYKSSDANKAFVGHTGVISGTSKGSAVITLSYTENGVTKSDTIEVIVTPFIVGDD
jgi:ribosomal protein L21E